MTLMIAEIVALAAVASAIYYGIFWLRCPLSRLRAIWKTLPVSLLAIAAMLGTYDAGNVEWLLVAALVLSALGDFSLAHEGEGWFVRGLVAFLAAHILYAILFLFEGQRSIGSDWLPIVVVAALAVGMLIHLWAHLGNMRGPVIVYTLAIAFMALSAAGTGVWFPLVAGVGLFLASDSILAHERFVMQPDAPHAAVVSHLVWWTYFFGQFLIAYGWIF